MKSIHADAINDARKKLLAELKSLARTVHASVDVLDEIGETLRLLGGLVQELNLDPGAIEEAEILVGDLGARSATLSPRASGRQSPETAHV